MTAAPSPLVSIVMPAYNAERFISQAITSVTNQTYPHWELLVINDASTDQTRQRVIRFVKDSRIKLLDIEHAGYSKALNAGLKAATGELIAFMDADDEYEPDALFHLVEYLHQHPEATAAYGLHVRINEQGQRIAPVYPYVFQAESGEYVLLEPNQHTWPAILLAKSAHQMQSLMMRSATLKRVGLMDEQFHASGDFLYFIRLFLDDFEGVHCIPKLIFRYRTYTGSITQDPERLALLLAQEPELVNYVFDTLPIPTEYQWLRPHVSSHRYRFKASVQAQNRQPALVRKIIVAALHDPNLPFGLWLRQCLHHYIRSFIPYPVTQTLWSVRHHLRLRVRQLLQPSSQPLLR